MTQRGTLAVWETEKEMVFGEMKMEFVTFLEDVVPPPNPASDFLGSYSIVTVKSIESDFFLSEQREEVQAAKLLKGLSGLS